MNPSLIAAAVRLAETLAAENAALRAMDLPGAARLMAAKAEAADAFTAAQALAEARGFSFAAAQRQAAEDVARRLRELAEENRRLLERALAVQSRVIGIVAQAAHAAIAQQAPRYGAHGALAGAAQAAPLALMARA
jgi:galactokinase